MEPMLSRLALETHQNILDNFTLEELARIRTTCRYSHQVVLTLLRQRLRTLSLKFLPNAAECEIFNSVLTRDGGAIVGSGAVWFYKPSHETLPNVLDIVMPSSSSAAMKSLFLRLGYV